MELWLNDRPVLTAVGVVHSVVLVVVVDLLGLLDGFGYGPLWLVLLISLNKTWPCAA